MRKQAGANYIARERKALENKPVPIDEFGLLQGRNSELIRVSNRVVRRVKNDK